MVAGRRPHVKYQNRNASWARRMTAIQTRPAEPKSRRNEGSGNGETSQTQTEAGIKRRRRQWLTKLIGANQRRSSGEARQHLDISPKCSAVGAFFENVTRVIYCTCPGASSDRSEMLGNNHQPQSAKPGTAAPANGNQHQSPKLKTAAKRRPLDIETRNSTPRRGNMRIAEEKSANSASK